MSRYYWLLYLAVAVLGIADSLIVIKLYQTARQPAASPEVLGEITLPINTRGQAGGSASAASAPTLAKTLNLDSVEAGSFLVYDADSGVTLAERGSSKKLAIASLTKLMTALVVYNNTPFTDTVTITESDSIKEEPVLGLRIGDTVTVGDLFHAMLVGSANDAALALARVVERTQKVAFSILMNNTARQLNMFETNFSNPLGFDNQNNFSSARDLALLVNATRRHLAFQLLGHSTSYAFTSEQGHNYSITATNTLIAVDPEISAIKTGYTLAAQGAMITSASRNSHNLIMIVLDSPNREHDTLILKQAVFDAYVWSQ